MHTYTDLLNFIPTLETFVIDQDQDSKIEEIRTEFIALMKNHMVKNYPDFIIEHTPITSDKIDDLKKIEVLSYLTLIIRNQRFDTNQIFKELKSGLVLKALQQLAGLLTVEHKVKLNDLLRIEDLSNVKIRLNIMFDGNWNPIEVFKDGNIQSILNGHYWNYNAKKSYKEGQITIGLIRIKPNENLWLLAHIGKVTKDLDIFNGVGYEFETLEEYSKYFGRLIVRYKNTTQALIRWADTIIDDCEIYQILPDVFDNDLFPGYENVNLSWKELSRVITKESWKTALQNQKAVYLITDTSNGKCYVGSAYGENMLLNRWNTYVKNKHGGNVQLKELSDEHIENNFKYSILDIFKASTDDNVIIARESWWKETLMTRQFGYNSN